MENQITHKYHGQKIVFDEKQEDWKVVIDFKEQHHKSLQVIKNYIDRRNKKEFTRVPVFVQKGNSYYDRQEGYEKAMITSVGVDGTIFVVREGRSSAEHCGTAYIQDAKNEALIKEIVALYKAVKVTNEKLRVAQNKLKEVNFEALRKKALGEVKE